MNTTASPRRGAGGRPPAARRAEVEERLLEAATRLFLTLGFEATSCDQVALDARAGKASIYTRYANKTALMTAVIDHNLARLFDAGQDVVDAIDAIDASASWHQRIVSAMRGVIERALQPDAVALLRLIVAEAPRLQEAGIDPATIVQRIGARRLALAIGAQPGARLAATQDAADAAADAAATLIDMLLMPGLMRALLGEDPALLRDAALARLETAVATLLGAGAVVEEN